MRATEDERRAFGRQLEDALTAAGLSQAQLRERLEMDQGVLTSRQAVSNWVRGRFAPDRRTTRALDRVLGTDGSLSLALGYTADPVPAAVEGFPPALIKWLSGLEYADQLNALMTMRHTAQVVADDVIDRLAHTVGVVLEAHVDEGEEPAALRVLAGLARRPGSRHAGADEALDEQVDADLEAAAKSGGSRVREKTRSPRPSRVPPGQDPDGA